MPPFVLAEAGTQFLQQGLGPRLGGDEWRLVDAFRNPTAREAQLRTRPPSTFNVCPVMKAASSLVRYDTVPTRSSTTSGRLIACMVAARANSASIFANPGRGLRASVPGDRVSPGEIALTVTPWGPSSVASARVKPTIPALLDM